MMTMKVKGALLAFGMVCSTANAGVLTATVGVEIADLVTGNPRAQGAWINTMAKCLSGRDQQVYIDQRDPYDFKSNVTAIVCNVL